MPSRSAIVGTIVAALAAVAIGIWLSFEIHWFPVAATTQAHNTDRLYHVLVIASIPIFVLVVTVVLFSVWQFRMKPGEELKDGPPIHGNTRLEVFWTALPAALLLGLVSYSFVVLYDNEKKPAGVPEVQIGVIGQQFFWTFEYPRSVTGGAPIRSYELYLPEGDTVYFNMRSRDVIHAFWIPAFRLQEDVVPGITTHYRATLDRLGSYPVVCNLLCGSGHSLMRSVAHVVTPARFQLWLRSQTGKSSSVATASTGGASATASTSSPASLSTTLRSASSRDALRPGAGGS
ncbi:MAG TPA: cytochrome c oxidase subunit II [Solirubrobacteraceae bacterium]|nr:cytochrome c oxidase subunit II [Solirubrobacteraceae bacterium]